MFDNHTRDVIDLWDRCEPPMEEEPHRTSAKCRHCGGDTAAALACCDGEATERELGYWSPDVAELDAPGVDP